MTNNTTAFTVHSTMQADDYSATLKKEIIANDLSIHIVCCNMVLQQKSGRCIHIRHGYINPEDRWEIIFPLILETNSSFFSSSCPREIEDRIMAMVQHLGYTDPDELTTVEELLLNCLVKGADICSSYAGQDWAREGGLRVRLY